MLRDAAGRAPPLLGRVRNAMGRFAILRGRARMGLSPRRLFFVAAAAVALPMVRAAAADTAATDAMAGSLGGRLAPSARDLRVFRQDMLPAIALVSIFAAIGLPTIFYLVRGRVLLSLGPSGP